MDKEILTKIGLTETQAKLYLTLVKNGPLSPVELSNLSGETRTNAYAVSEKLIAMGLAKKDDSMKMIIAPESPEKLKYILAKKQQKIKEVSNDFSSVMPGLLSAFYLNNNVSNIINVSGKEAIEMAYDSMLNTKKDIYILSNGYDYKIKPELLEIIRKHGQRIEKAKIRTYTLMQSDVYDVNHKINPSRVVKPLPEGIKLNVRIMIFGDNVVISIIKEDSINSTIISSPEIAASLKSIFINIWNNNPTDLPGHPDKNILLPTENS